MNKYSSRDYLVGRMTLPKIHIKCRRCREVFITYKPNEFCRVCKARPRDFNDQFIEVGDRYFTGNPPAFGRVIKVNKTSIVLEIGSDYLGRNQIQRVSSPDQGICVDKTPA